MLWIIYVTDQSFDLKIKTYRSVVWHSSDGKVYDMYGTYPVG